MAKEKYLELNQVNAYKISFGLSNNIWNIVKKWDYLSRDTIGKQFIRSTDSISANIAEGFGRYGKKDKIRFYQIAKGSIYESLDWLQKSKVRNLIGSKEYEISFKVLKSLPKEINSLIKYTNLKLTI
jgi:four helix bundle protein